MANNDLKELLFGHIREIFDDANVLQKKRQASRVQARHRSTRSSGVDNASSQEIRDKNNDSMRQEDRR